MVEEETCNLLYIIIQDEFHSNINCRYNWTVPGLPSVCACGTKNDFDHALTCKKWGYPILRHDALRNSSYDYEKGWMLICET